MNAASAGSALSVEIAGRRVLTADWVNLFFQLRDDGFAITVDREKRALLLIHQLSAAQIELDESSFSHYLAPLICTTADDQLRVSQIVEKWLRRTEDSGRTAQLHSASERLRRYDLRYLAIAGFALLAGVTVVLVSGSTPSAPTVPAVIEFVKRLAFAAPALLALYVIVSRRKRRTANLSRRRNEMSTAKYFDIPIQTTHFFSSSAARASMFALSRGELFRTNQMDRQRTIAATFKAMGFPFIVFQTGRTSREIVLLVDHNSFADHIELIATALHDRLIAAGALLTRYDYHLYPTRLRFVSGHRAVEGTMALDSVASQHDSARLIILSSGEALVDPRGRLSPELMRALTAFSNAVLLTPTPEGRWGDLERTLVGAGVFVAPASSDGIVRIADYLHQNPDEPFQRLRDAIPDGDDPFIDRLKREYSLLSSDIPPDDRQIRRLVNDLAVYMGDEDSFNFLATVAAFPKIDPHISLALGHIMFEKGLNEGQVGKIARLPWFRDGRMPDWLRIAIWNHLQNSGRERSRTAIGSMLELVEEIGSDQLDWDALHRHAAMVIARPKQRSVNDLFFSPMPPGPLSEQLFLNFMRGAHLDPIANAIDPVAPPNVRRPFERDFDRRTLIIWAVFGALGTILFVFGPELVNFVGRAIQGLWQGLIGTLQFVLNLFQRLNIFFQRLNIFEIFDATVSAIVVYAFFRYLEKNASTRAKRAISEWLWAPGKEILFPVRRVQMVLKNPDVHPLTAVGIVLGVAVFFSVLIVPAALKSPEKITGVLSSSVVYAVATYAVFRFLDKTLSRAANATISGWIRSQGNYFGLAVTQVQGFINRGDKHPLDAIGYLAAGIVFLGRLLLGLVS